jgi:hypothetical protein
MHEPPSLEVPRRRNPGLEALTRPPVPLALIGLVTFVVITILSVRYAGDLFPDDREARGHVLQIAAGVLVTLGVYFTALGLTFNRWQKRVELLGEAIDRLVANNEAVRIGAVWTLEHLAYDSPRSRGQAFRTLSVHRAISAALEAAGPGSEAFTRAREEVQQTLAYLDPQHFSTSKRDLDTSAKSA